jgi:hypothetical protein
MKKLGKFLLAASLTVAAMVSAVPKASAEVDYCYFCNHNGGCATCCRCYGDTAETCRQICS